MVSRALCTTSLEDTWPDDGPVVFLGEWCRRYTRKDRWSKMDALVAPYHWDDRAKMHADYRYLLELYERLLVDLTKQLNGIHGTEHGTRYWRILIGPWLGYFTQMLFDRWTCIRRAADDYELSGSMVLVGAEEQLIPNDMGHFARLFGGDEWNHRLYAEILQRFTGVRCIPRERAVAVRYDYPASYTNARQKMKLRLAAWYSRLAASLTRDEDAFLMGTYLSVFDEARLNRRLGQVPQLWQHTGDRPSTRASPDSRRWVLEGAGRSEFETCARVLIPQQIPIAYLEGYAALVEHVDRLPWPKRPRLIWTSNAHFYDDVFKAWAASKVERGAPFVIGQHGGHYGTGRWSFLEDHETASSDRYLTWGWSEPEQPHTIPVGLLKTKRPRDRRNADEGGALLVTAMLPRFSYVMYSVCVSRQVLDYFEDQFAFVASLPAQIRDELTVRVYPHDHGWEQASRWRDRFPGVRIDAAQAKFEVLLKGCRLCISTYNATTYLETFAMDVPTVIYWNESHWELRDSAQPYFDELKRAGIFHATPESAAQHVARIWSDVGGWWSSAAVRAVLERFKHRYCDLPQDLLGCVEHVLRDAISEARGTFAQ